MPAGKRDRRIEIRQATTSTGSFGETLLSWNTLGEFWAEYIPGVGQEEFDANQRSNERRVVFELLYTPGINNRMEVLYDGEKYDIESIVEVGRRDRLRLICTSREVTSGPS